MKTTDNHITAIGRSPQFSPNSEKNDRLVLQEVSNVLRQDGFCVEMVSEDDIHDASRLRGRMFLSMARRRSVLEILEEKEKDGAVVVNPPSALLRNTRIYITQRLMAEKFAIPASEVLKTGDIPQIGYPLWVKRGEECAQTAGDVCFVENESQLQRVWEDFRRRGIGRAVINRHEEGDLLKFYGVDGTGFFHTCLPTENGGTGKFGAEAINGEPHHYRYDRKALEAECNRISQALGMPVYGGDCIVGSNGEFRIIDFNDWPSFSCCRTEAATAIAHLFEAQCRNNNYSEKTI